MPDPDAATTAALAAYREIASRSPDYFMSEVEMIDIVMAAARPLIEAEATARERQRAETAEAVALLAEDYVRDDVPQLIAEAVAEATARERQRIRPLLRALHNLYDVVWNQIGTVDLSHVITGYNGISYDDDNAVEAAAKPVEALLATGQFADLLDGDGDA